jgi:glycosyltransferase involved in cell wall biosynthesis
MGGTERFCAWLTAELISHGHKATVFIMDKEGAPPRYALAPLAQIRYYEAPPDGGAKAVGLLRRKIQEVKPDVCIVPFWDNTLLLWLTALAGMSVPVIASEQSAPDYIEHYTWNRTDRLTALAGADRIHHLSKSFGESLPQPMRGHTVVIPNPLMLVPEKLSESKMDGNILLSVGRLDNNKQYALLIRAFALVAQRHPKWSMQIWGNGPERETLVRLTDKLLLRGKVEIMGETEKIGQIYSRADLFCVPSKSEGQSLVLLEAAAHGLPSVGFATCPGVNEIISHGQNGLLVEDMTAEGLAESLDLLMGDTALRLQMAVQAKASVSRYASEVSLSQWLALIEETAILEPRLSRLRHSVLDYSSLLSTVLEEGTGRSLADAEKKLSMYDSRFWRLGMRFYRVVEYFRRIAKR